MPEVGHFIKNGLVIIIIPICHIKNTSYNMLYIHKVALSSRINMGENNV